MNSDLAKLRADIDEVDKATVMLLAKRFSLTQQIGYEKRDNGLPAIDPAREEALLAKIRQYAQEAGLDPEFTAKLWRAIIDETVKRHQAMNNLPAETKPGNRP